MRARSVGWLIGITACNQYVTLSGDRLSVRYFGGSLLQYKVRVLNLDEWAGT